MSDETDPFEVLGVPVDADDRTVRQQYAKRIREVRARGDDDDIQIVQVAFEAIRDVDARARLRGHAETDSDLSPLLKEAATAAEAGDFPRANALYHELLEEAPESEVALLAVHEYHRSRERYDHAVWIARRLVKVAPRNAAYHALSAETLMAAAQTNESGDRVEERVKLALKHLRRARELGDDSIGLTIFEARIQWALGRRQLASKMLSERLRSSGELRTVELEAGLELLRLHSAGGWTFRETLDTIASLLPESDERRRTIGVALCDLASELADTSLPRAIECAELAEVCCPGDEDIDEFAAQLRGSQEQFADNLIEAAENEQLVLPEPDTQDSFWDSWGKYIFLLIVIKAIVGLKLCGPQRGPIEWHDPDGTVEEIDLNDPADRERFRALLEENDPRKRR